MSRAVKLVERHFTGEVPDLPAHVLELEPEKSLWKQALSTIDRMETAVRNMKLNRGIADINALVKAGNKYFGDKEPWKQAKEDDKGPLSVTLSVTLEVLAVVSGLLYPVMPGKMGELRQAIGLGSEPPDIRNLKKWRNLTPGANVKSSILFPKPEKKKIASPEKVGSRPSGTKKQKPSSKSDAENVLHPNQISFDEFKRLQLRTARIDLAERVEGTDKLMRMELTVGEEKRQIVAGIAQHYAADELSGKTIVIVANLKPAKIRGVESNGMLLAANLGDRLRLITVDGEMGSGAEVR